MLGRALARRCLRCGTGRVFVSFFTLADHCPRCDLPIEREEGYWVGALIINLAAAIGAYAVFLLGGIALFWPEPPWTVLLVGGVSVMALLPVVGYPWSKMLWWWLDVSFVHPPGPDWTRWEDDVRAPHSQRLPY